MLVFGVEVRGGVGEMVVLVLKQYGISFHKLLRKKKICSFFSPKLRKVTKSVSLRSYIFTFQKKKAGSDF